MKHPFNCIISGPTSCGKTTFLRELLRHKNDVVEDFPERVIYYYKEWQKTFDEIKSIIYNIEFYEGLPSVEELNEISNALIILDDLNNQVVNSEHVMNLFTVGSHHKQLSVIFLTQNMFLKGRFSRDLSLNANYLVLFKNPRDQLQIKTLSTQMFPGKSLFLVNAFNDATMIPFGYLFIDLKQDTLAKNRIQTGILPKQMRIIYSENKNI